MCIRDSDNNAEEITDDFFLFLISDPQIFFSIDNADELIGLEMEFEILDYRYATDSPKAVSYTHLDVYKRQTLSCAAAGLETNRMLNFFLVLFLCFAICLWANKSRKEPLYSLLK